MSDVAETTTIYTFDGFTPTQVEWIESVFAEALASTSETMALSHLVGRFAGRCGPEAVTAMILAFGGSLDRWNGAPEESAEVDIIAEVETPRLRETRSDHEPLTNIEFYYRVQCNACGGEEALCRDECVRTDYSTAYSALASWHDRLGEPREPHSADVGALQRGMPMTRRGLTVSRMYRKAT